MTTDLEISVAFIIFIMIFTIIVCCKDDHYIENRVTPYDDNSVDNNFELEVIEVEISYNNEKNEVNSSYDTKSSSSSTSCNESEV